MSAPVVVDSMEFARARQRVSGSLPAAGLARIGDLLADSAGDLDYVIEGGYDSRGRPRLELRIGGLLHLQCQRCLSRMDYRLEVANTLILVPAGTLTAEDDEDPDAPDSIEASKELNINDLIEDEVLLSLPSHPRHPDGACERLVSGDGAGQGRSAKFAGLAALKNLEKSVKE